MKPLRQRKSPRLQGYDYAQSGAYFVTICTHNRICLFGEIEDYTVCLTEIGVVAARCWMEIPDHYPSAELDLWVVMPNHMHGILVLTDHFVGTRNCASVPKKQPTLGQIINSYKGAVTRVERKRRDNPQLCIWQERYHDHIIRNEADLNRIREYVLNNPTRWAEDTYFEV